MDLVPDVLHMRGGVGGEELLFNQKFLVRTSTDLGTDVHDPKRSPRTSVRKVRADLLSPK